MFVTMPEDNRNKIIKSGIKQDINNYNYELVTLKLKKVIRVSDWITEEYDLECKGFDLAEAKEGFELLFKTISKLKKGHD